MLPKSKQQYYVGYDNGSKSIKYHNADTKRVLTSRNFHFIKDMDRNQETPSENIIINPAPALQHEGEFGGNTPQAGKLSGLKRKGEMSVLDDETVKKPARKLRVNLHVNYRYLNNPFTEDNGHEQALASAEVIIWHIQNLR